MICLLKISQIVSGTKRSNCFSSVNFREKNVNVIISVKTEHD